MWMVEGRCIEILGHWKAFYNLGWAFLCPLRMVRNLKGLNTLPSKEPSVSPVFLSCLLTLLLEGYKTGPTCVPLALLDGGPLRRDDGTER